MKVYCDFSITKEVEAFTRRLREGGMPLEYYVLKSKFLKKKVNVVMASKEELIKYAKSIKLIDEKKYNKEIYLIERERNLCNRMLYNPLEEVKL